MTIGLSFMIFKNKATLLNTVGIFSLLNIVSANMMQAWMTPPTSGIGIALAGTALYHYFSHVKKHSPVNVADKKEQNRMGTS